MRRIVENAGGEGSYAIARTLAQDNPRWGFDAAARRFRDLPRAGIVDPVKVVRMALRTAVPAAARAIAAEAVVAGSPPPADPETKALPDSALPGGRSGE
ncbi:MAG: chaperonin GroEL, partial [Rhodospirillales bacterium]|nr:chaperonin GroEL [Rhodospirillales bacterium]